MTTKIDLVNEAADWSEKAGNGVIATYLREYADLLEAQAKAEPVAVVIKNINNFEGVAFTARDWRRLGNLPAGTALYTEPREQSEVIKSAMFKGEISCTPKT